ncbi:hypothetical protein KCP78_10890 [Salmonella enterica subsp. enterica]|nr:hypothetical protein KCP78_10890 [Salmonella enterica subsp. enterica]
MPAKTETRYYDLANWREIAALNARSEAGASGWWRRIAESKLNWAGRQSLNAYQSSTPIARLPRMIMPCRPTPNRGRGGNLFAPVPGLRRWAKIQTQHRVSNLPAEFSSNHSTMRCARRINASQPQHQR